MKEDSRKGGKKKPGNEEEKEERERGRHEEEVGSRLITGILVFYCQSCFFTPIPPLRGSPKPPRFLRAFSLPFSFFRSFSFAPKKMGNGCGGETREISPVIVVLWSFSKFGSVGF